MKKILTGFLGLFLVIGIVAGAGYAVFTDEVNITGMVLGTATPNLKISFDDVDANYSTTLAINGAKFAPLLPGELDWGEFWLRNESNGTTDKLDFALKAKISAYSGNWDILKDVIQARVCLYDEAGVGEDRCDEGNATSWMTLATWYSADRTLPGGNLLQGNDRHYTIQFQIPSSYDNAIMTKSVTMNMIITGTQAL
jgi:hypothetical protein